MSMFFTNLAQIFRSCLGHADVHNKTKSLLYTKQHAAHQACCISKLRSIFCAQSTTWQNCGMGQPEPQTKHINMASRSCKNPRTIYDVVYKPQQPMYLHASTGKGALCCVKSLLQCLDCTHICTAVWASRTDFHGDAASITQYRAANSKTTKIADWYHATHITHMTSICLCQHTGMYDQQQ